MRLGLRGLRHAAWLAGALAGLAGSTASAQNALGDGTALDNTLRRGAGPVNGTPFRVTGNAQGQRVIDSPGDGRALDYNLQQGTGGFNSPGRNFRAEVAFRNAIVTGNAPGGRSFRGDVGYRATDDFRASLGSDTVFDFERDAFYSGAATRNVRGVGAIQYQLGQSTAGQSRGLAGELILRRPGGGIDAAGVRDPAASAAQRGIDPFGYLGGSLRSTSAFGARTADFPSILGQSREDATIPEAERGTPSFLIASPLTGVRNFRGTNPLLGLGADSASEGDRAPVEREVIGQPLNQRIGTGTTHADLLQSLRSRSNRIDPRTGELADAPATTPVPTADRPSPEDAAPTNPIDDLLDRLRGTMNRTLPDVNTPDQSPAPTPTPGGTTSETPATSPRTPGVPSGAPEDEPRVLKHDDGTTTPLPTGGSVPAPSVNRSEVQRLIEQAQEVLGRDPTLVTDLVDKVAPDQPDLFTIHTTRGQELLGDGRWFEAEERFSAALRARPGDPMAAAWRVHAQIGAGMFVSAAVNLRNLLKGYPELINARFDAALLPSGDRLKAIRAQLRDRAARDAGIARDAGLLLAYLGHQTGSPDDIRDGFAAVRRLARPDPESEPLFDELERILIALWEKP